jgi:hypothetical protein
MQLLATRLLPRFHAFVWRFILHVREVDPTDRSILYSRCGGVCDDDLGKAVLDKPQPFVAASSACIYLPATRVLAVPRFPALAAICYCAGPLGRILPPPGSPPSTPPVQRGRPLITWHSAPNTVAAAQLPCSYHAAVVQT